jgi:mutator protein MutT
MTNLTLTLLFLVRGNQVLLAMKKRGFGAGRLNGVGGKIEENESIEQALVRESQEEIGITPTNFEKMAEINFDEYFKDEPAIMNVHVFIAQEWVNEPTESEEMSPQWFDKDKLPFDNMWPDDIYWLPLVLDNKKLKAQFKLDKNDKITSHNIIIVQNF